MHPLSYKKRKSEGKLRRLNSISNPLPSPQTSSQEVSGFITSELKFLLMLPCIQICPFLPFCNSSHTRAVVLGSLKKKNQWEACRLAQVILQTPCRVPPCAEWCGSHQEDPQCKGWQGLPLPLFLCNIFLSCHINCASNFVSSSQQASSFNKDKNFLSHYFLFLVLQGFPPRAPN